MRRPSSKRLLSLGRALTLVVIGAAAGEFAIGCHEAKAPSSPPIFVPLERGVALPLVTVVTPENERVAPLLGTLQTELRGTFDVDAVFISKDSTSASLEKDLEARHPRALVLVDNSSVQLYAPIAQRDDEPIPSLIVMTSFVRELQKRVKNSTAIEFEPSAVTTLTDVRKLLGREIRRAGVIYREGFEAFIEEERRRAASESIELVAIRVPSEPNVDRVSRALRQLEQQRVDAVWVTNDNALLTRRLLAKAWVPFAKQAKLPIAVGVPSLVTSAVPFGTYAAVPDTIGLGVQAADVLLELSRHEYRAARIPVEPAVAIKTYMNVDLSRQFGAPPENERRVDVLVRGGEVEGR